VRAFADWLALREPADAAARAPELVEPVRRHLARTGRAVIHDLGTGTGSMGRWLGARLSGPQHWIMYDRDAGLLERAAAGLAGVAAADGAAVTVETRVADITRLSGELDGASLVTASALLDMLTADEIDRIVTACAGCPTLLTISVLGEVRFTPPDPLDLQIAAAFNAHQRRTVGGQSLLGPDAAAAAITAFRRRGVNVQVRPSPWRLGGEASALIAEWLRGWVDAACEQQPALTGQVGAYTERRLAQAAAGRLEVVLGHQDLLAGCE
jgi:hypothetical protein